MRLCRIRHQKRELAAFYDETHLLPVAQAARLFRDATHETLALPEDDDLLPLLACGSAHAAASKLAQWVARQDQKGMPESARLKTEEAELLVPVPRPNKLFLLAGNYARHIEEGGGIAAERSETFPYVFMKPPTTTLTSPGKPVTIPKISPQAIDWELELAVVIGRGGKHIAQQDALAHVAGYTVINDISNRKFRPNPQRKERDKDSFFDWLHGKWHDSFCPCGPCVTSADAIADPQTLQLQLRLNGQLKQDSTTAQQIFPVAAVIEFISSMVTLEPGDVISTGTPAGVGSASGTFLQPGDRLEASISQIGTLVSPVQAEA